jgi:hypothetical protein
MSSGDRAIREEIASWRGERAGLDGSFAIARVNANSS